MKIKDTGTRIMLESNFVAVMSFWYDVDEIFKNKAEALEAAELLKAFFEAKQEGKDAVLIIDNATPGALDWQDGYAKGLDDGYKNGLEVGRAEVAAARREGWQTAMLEMHQAQTQPSHYQLRLERYAVDIYCNTEDIEIDGIKQQMGTHNAVKVAASIIAAAEKAREHGT